MPFICWLKWCFFIIVTVKLGILGPTTAIIPKINNIYHYQIIIKYKDTKKIYPFLKFISNKYQNNKVTVGIDFNPNKIWKNMV